ncbi:hypothetical protein PV11_04904 [Exophiala sideris]|uniref:Xylanolytic transcriptional activator regulatory domain-containing protein n=1 Tax=Exophiala sideris TaxID=1016849 RepID=A0A0D1X569_9EURO|nr:hypothetical protein PV11_04904 [Exophiala sideris]
MDFFSDAPASLQQYAYGSGTEVLSGFDWVFNDSVDDVVPYVDAVMAPTGSNYDGLRPSGLNIEQVPSLNRATPGLEGSVGSNNPFTPSEEPENSRVSVPEDRWPMEWHAVPAQLSSLPPLGQPGQLPTYSRHFELSPISASTREGILSSIRQSMQGSPWQAVSLSGFPSEATLDRCIDMYFAHFHKNVPIIHRPTFDPAKDHALTLAMAAIGVCYTGLFGAISFSNALSELTRRLLMFLAEFDPRFVRTGDFVAAQLLQSIHGFSSGSKRLYELSESSRSTLINNARNMGIFEHRTRSCSVQGTLQQQWAAWIYEERMRRVAWALYLHDASSTYTRNAKPYISLMDIRAMDLPCSTEHWESDTPQAWAAMHPWSRSIPPNVKYNEALESILQKQRRSEVAIFDDYQKHILLATTMRLLWETMELEFSAGGSLINDHLGERRKLLHAAILQFSTPLTTSSMVQGEADFEAKVQLSRLAQYAFVIDADDLINYTHLVWRGSPTSGPARKVLLEWGAKNPRKVRQVARAAAFVLNTTRQFPYNHHLEAHHAFHAGFLVWSMIPLLRSLQDPMLANSLPDQQLPSPHGVCQLDCLASDDAVEGERVAQWVERGGSCVLRMHAVPDVLSEEGSQQILQQTADILKRMPVWGIAQVFRNAVLRALQANEQ